MIPVEKYPPTFTGPNLSFAGCGFLGIYHVGVAACIKRYAPHLLTNRVAGASAGALVACAVMSGASLSECTTFTLKLATDARSRALGPVSPSFQLVSNLRKALDKFLPPDAHDIVSGRLFISLTRISDKENVMVSQFATKQELIDALICSSFVPFYSGLWPPSYKGVRYIDGAVTDNLPILNANTITVSPFAGESDICPDDRSNSLHHINLGGTSFQLTAANVYRVSVSFFPPTMEVLSDMCRQGFGDALRYLRKTKMITCTDHLSIQSDIISSSQLAFLYDDSFSDTETSSSDVAVVVDVDESVCYHCQEVERNSLTAKTPVHVEMALQAACDDVNLNFFAPLYRSKIYQTLTYLALPYILPIEISINLIKKFYDWAPYMTTDMYQFYVELYEFARQQLKKYHLTNDWEISGIDWGVRMGLRVRQRRKKSSIRKPVSPVADRKSVVLVSFEEPARIVVATNSSMNVNMTLNVNYNVNSPLQCVDDMRRQLMLEGGEGNLETTPSISLADASQDTTDLSNVSGAISRRSHVSDAAVTPYPSACDMPHTEALSGLKSSMKTKLVRRKSSDAHHAALGCADSSFEECLQFVTQQESILSYYYTEEGGGPGGDEKHIKVVEIFPMKHTCRHEHESADDDSQRKRKKSRASDKAPTI